MSLAFKERSSRHIPSDELIRGIEQFNGGNYMECRATLEFVSLHEPRREKNLYKGISQVAVGLNHWREGDYRGAIRLFRTGIRFLQHVAPVCEQVDVSALIRETENIRTELEELGMEGMKALDSKLIPHIRMGVTRSL